MEPKPVQHHQQPAYPTRREVLAGAATFALANLAGCGFVFADSEGGKIIVAPIFEHGAGRGAEGCRMVVPPVFLSEEEGMQILREELAKHGVQLKAGATLEGVLVPARSMKYESVDKRGGKKELKVKVVEDTDKAKPLKPSGNDSDKNIAVEFVSAKNYFDLGGPSPLSTVTYFDFKEVAEYAAAQAKKQGKGRVLFGVFYDPSPELPRIAPPKDGDRMAWRTELNKRDAQGKEDSKKLLRQQAQDFVAWLKEQKAIQ